MLCPLRAELQDAAYDPFVAAPNRIMQEVRKYRCTVWYRYFLLDFAKQITLGVHFLLDFAKQITLD